MNSTASTSHFIIPKIKGIEIVRSVFTIVMLIVAISFQISCKAGTSQNTSSARNANSSPPPPSARCPEVCPNRVLIGLNDAPSKTGIERIKAAIEGDLDKAIEIRPVGGLNVVMISAPALTVQQVKERLKNEFLKTVYIEPDFQMRINSAPTDPLFTNQWGLNNTGQALGVCGTDADPTTTTAVAGADIHALEAWDQVRGVRKAVVAEIDTGVNYNHEDLVGSVWSSPLAFDLTVGGQQVHCPLYSHGFNAITGTCDPMDDDSGHGTHLAGIIGAEVNNAGVVGVTPSVSIIAIKAFHNGGCVSQVANAIDFLVQIKQRPELNANVVVVNNSYGFLGQTDDECQPDDNCSSKTLRAAVQHAGEYKMLFVAAAGNDGLDTQCFPVYPASFNLPNVISVAASDNTDALATFSNYGSSSVHLAAPGVGICSTVNNANLYGYNKGTSMAAPFVSGAAALLWSRCHLGTEALKQVLLDNVDRPIALQDKTITGGRLNVARAVKACGGGPASE